MIALALAVTLLGGVSKGGTLYVKETGFNLTDKADGGGKKTPLQKGDEVTWSGPDEKNKAMQQVVFRGKKGYLPSIALTPNRVADEIVSTDGKTTSATAFAAGGKADFGEPPPPNASAEDKAKLAQLKALRASSLAQRAKVGEHVKAQGLGGSP